MCDETGWRLDGLCSHNLSLSVPGPNDPRFSLSQDGAIPELERECIPLEVPSVATGGEYLWEAASESAHSVMTVRGCPSTIERSPTDADSGAPSHANEPEHAHYWPRLPGTAIPGRFCASQRTEASPVRSPEPAGEQPDPRTTQAQRREREPDPKHTYPRAAPIYTAC